MNIFEPGDTIILHVRTSFPDDDKGDAAVQRIMDGIHEAADGLCKVRVIHAPAREPGIEVLGVYRPSKTCVCE